MSARASKRVRGGGGERVKGKGAETESEKEELTAAGVTVTHHF